MPSSDDLALLDAVLDALDRLYDHATTVVDVRALLFATGKALRDQDIAEVVTVAHAVRSSTPRVRPIRRAWPAMLRQRTGVTRMASRSDQATPAPGAINSAAPDRLMTIDEVAAYTQLSKPIGVDP